MALPRCDMRKILLAALAVLSFIASAQAQRAIVTPQASFSRPANTITYTSGNAVTNSTTTASVLALPFTFSQNAGQPAYIRRVTIKKSGTGVTAPNFRLHLFNVQPTPLSSDNIIISMPSTGYFCSMDVSMFTTDPFVDGNVGIGVPNNGSECGVIPTATTIWGLMEARGAYAPASAEVFTITLEAYFP